MYVMLIYSESIKIFERKIAQNNFTYSDSKIINKNNVIWRSITVVNHRMLMIQFQMICKEMEFNRTKINDVSKIVGCIHIAMLA